MLVRLLNFFCVMCVVLGFAPAAARAQQPITVSARVSSPRVYVGESFILQIEIDGASSVPTPTLPAIEGLESRFRGGQDTSSQSTVIINGRRTDSSKVGYAMQFDLVITRPGSLMIPPITVNVGGKEYVTQPISVHAVPPQEDKDVRLRIEVDNPNPYVGEPVRLRVVLGLGRDAAAAAFSIPGVDTKFDTVDEPDLVRQLQSETIFEVLGAQVPAKASKVEFGDVSMTAYTAERVIIPREAGRLTIGPATASVEVIERRKMSVFDRDQTRRAVVPSAPLVLNVRPLPSEGRPANFNGLVGQYRLSVRASPTEVNVGDPITISIRVEGPLAAQVPAPALDRQANLVESFRLASEETPGSMDGRSKIFTRTLRALRDDVTRIPPIELPYFDVASGQYSIARSEPIDLKVRPTRVITASDAEVRPDAEQVESGLAIEDRAGGIRANYEGADLLLDQSFSLGVAMTRPTVLAAVVAPPAAYALISFTMMARRRAAKNAPTSRRRRALSEARAALASASGDGSGVALGVSAAVRRYVGAKFNQPAEGLTGRECAELARGADPGIAAGLQALLDRCDAALYGGLPLDEAHRLRSDAESLLEGLERAVEGKR